MPRRRLAWLLSLALMAAGGVIAHALAYRLVAAHDVGLGRSSQPVAHDHYVHWRICLAVCGALAAVGLASAVVHRLRGRGAAAVPVWVFGVLPPAGFVVQEHAERFLANGSFPVAAALEPTFAIGILLQLPFALAAYFLARALVAFAAALALRLGEAPRARVVSLADGLAPAEGLPVPLLPLLSLGHGQRAPPLPTLS